MRASRNFDSDQYEDPRSYQRSNMRPPVRIPVFRILLALVVLLALGGGAYAAFKFLNPSPLPSGLQLPTNTTVVTQIQSLGRLETVSFTIEKVISYDPNANNAFAHLFGDSKKLFVAHGDVVAGIDLSKLGPNDVQRIGNSITLNLPAPQILSATVDPNRSQVYDANTGFYSLFPSNVDPNTMLQILTSAQGSLRTDACQADILQKASDNAKNQLTAFLTTVGFQNVVVNIPTGTCA